MGGVTIPHSKMGKCPPGRTIPHCYFLTRRTIPHIDIIRNTINVTILITCNLVSVVDSGHKQLRRPETAYKLYVTWRMLCVLYHNELWQPLAAKVALICLNGENDQLNYTPRLFCYKYSKSKCISHNITHFILEIKCIFFKGIHHQYYGFTCRFLFFKESCV